MDVSVDEVEKANTFYTALFGWDVEVAGPEYGGYGGCRKDGRRVAGITPKMNPKQPSAWTVYLATDDVDATVAKVGRRAVRSRWSRWTWARWAGWHSWSTRAVRSWACGRAVRRPGSSWRTSRGR